MKYSLRIVYPMKTHEIFFKNSISYEDEIFFKNSISYEDT